MKGQIKQTINRVYMQVNAFRADICLSIKKVYATIFINTNQRVFINSLWSK